jgi:hypothetical protein
MGQLVAVALGRVRLLLRRVSIAVHGGISLRLRSAIPWLGVTLSIWVLRIHVGAGSRIARRLLVRPRRGAVATTAAGVRGTSPAAAKSTPGAVVRRLVDADGAAIKLHIVHGRHGVVGISFLEVSHESETTAASSITIFDDDCFLNGTKLLKLLAKSALLSVPRKAADEEFRHFGCVLL